MIHDPDVRRLADMATELKREYVEADGVWAGSPFAWIKAQPSSRRRGKIGEQLVERWCVQHGLRVEGVRDTQADTKVQDHRVEVKSSTRWETGIYKFQQIRDQDYAFLICLGLSPTSAHCWIIPKAVVFSKDVLFVYVTPQHGGKKKGKYTYDDKNEYDTYWFRVDPGEPDEWLAPYGGTLAAASQVLKRLIGTG